MKTACINLEGVLAPCLWEEIGKVATLPELEHAESHLSDNPEAAMRERIALLRQHRLRIDDLHFIASMYCPLAGATAFVRALSKEYRVRVVSDLPAELAAHFTAAFDEVELICPDFTVSRDGYLEAGALAPDFKESAIRSLTQAGIRTIAIGHTAGDLPMLRKADTGILYRPSAATRLLAKDLEAHDTYRAIMKHHLSFAADGFFASELALEPASACRHHAPPGLLS